MDVSNNQLNYLPDEIGDIVTLTRLNVASNKLHSLPSTIGRLSELLHLGCSFLVPSFS